jgi:hypothetical protein
MLAVLVACGTAAHAVIKCQDGETTAYGDAPCPGGTRLKLENQPAPPRDAAKRLEQEKKEVREMQRSRRHREARIDKEQQRAARSAAVVERRCTRLARELRWAEQDAAAAAGKRAARARLKAVRANETYEETCRHRAGLKIGTGG